MFKKVIAIVLLSFCMLALFTGCGEELGIGEDTDITYRIENGEAEVKEVPNISTLTEIVIPDEYDGCPVVKINDFSAVNLESVEKISIGKNVKEIGEWAFENNQKLTAFEVSEENEYFCDVDGVLYTKDMKTLLFYPPAKVPDNTNGDENAEKVAAYTIPDGVKTIRTKAFYKCDKITGIVIPDSVERIEEKAFFRCGSISEIILPENLQHIGKDAFAYCYGLSEMTIPGKIEEIGDYAFYNCTSLMKIEVLKAEENIVFGKKWSPTNNGQSMDTQIIFKD